MMITIPQDIYAVMDAWGKSEMRNNSQAALFLIQEGLKNRGLLPGDPAPVETAIANPEPATTVKPVPKGVETPQAFKFRIRDNYFQLMNKGCFTPTRLKELALGEQPTKAELGKVERILADQDLNAE